MNKTQFSIPSNVTAAAAVRLYALHQVNLHGGDRNKAAAALEVDPTTLRRWLADLEGQGVTVPAPTRRAGRARRAINVLLPAGIAI